MVFRLCYRMQLLFCLLLLEQEKLKRDYKKFVPSCYWRRLCRLCASMHFSLILVFCFKHVCLTYSITVLTVYFLKYSVQVGALYYYYVLVIIVISSSFCLRHEQHSDINRFFCFILSVWQVHTLLYRVERTLYY